MVTTPGIPNYRQQLRKVLPDHYFRPDPWPLLWIPFHFAVIGLCFWALSQHFSWWLAPICALVIGHSFGCLGFLAHDVGHGGTVRPLWARDFIAFLCFSPFFIAPKLWRRWHNAEHHGHTQVEGVDPDHLFTMEHYAENKILQALYRLHPVARNLVIFGSYTFRMTQQQIRMLITYLRSPLVPGGEKALMLGQGLAQLGLWVGLTAWLGPNVLVWGFLIPHLVGNALVISYISTNHFLNPLGDAKDVLGSSLTVTLPGWLKWLDPLHNYFGAHVAHHLFPQASPRHARAIEAKIQEMFPDRYHTMSIFRALKMLWDTPWVYENGTMLVDPHRGEKHPTLGHGLEERVRR